MARDREAGSPTTQRDSNAVGSGQHSQPATGGGRDTAAIADSSGNLHLLPYADAAAGTYGYSDGCRVYVYPDGTCLFIPYDYTGPASYTPAHIAYPAATPDAPAIADTATFAESDDLHTATGMRPALSASDLSTDT